MDNMQEIAAALDEQHELARSARLRKDYDAYKDVFSSELIFQAETGGAIDRDRLMRNVRAHDRRFVIVDTRARRTKLQIDGATVTETLVQTAVVQVHLFLGLHYRWTSVRHSKFVWARPNGKWQIEHTKIDAELIKSRRFCWLSAKA